MAGTALVVPNCSGDDGGEPGGGDGSGDVGADAGDGGPADARGGDAGDAGSVDTGPAGGTDAGGGECEHGQMPRPCGVDLGVCFRSEQRCVAGYWEPCPGEVEMGPELCDGKDNDCNGRIDDGLGVGIVCAIGVGVCRREGQQICDPAGSGAVTCSAEPGEPNRNIEACLALGEEPGCDICNDLDDDCDGSTDEHLVLGQPCSEGVGACARNGVSQCAEDGTIGCSAVAGEPRDELCGDNIDNNCDGETDEGFDVGGACDLFLDGCRLPGTTMCSEDQVETECQVDPDNYPDCPPARQCAPVGLKAYPCNREIDVVWTPVPCATSYRLNYGIDGGPGQAEAFGGISPRVVRGETANLRGLDNSITYTIQLASQFASPPDRLTDILLVRPGGNVPQVVDEEGEVIASVLDTDDELVVPEGTVVTMYGAHVYSGRVEVGGGHQPKIGRAHG